MSASDIDDSLPLSRILAKRPGFFRTVERGDRLFQVFDSSSLPYLVEEFVASAAVDIAITATSPAVQHLNDLPAPLRSRILVVDEDGSARKQVAAILEPVGAEFHFAFSDSNGAVSASLRTPPAVLTSLGVLLPALYDFILGARYRLQVDVDLTLVREALGIFRSHARSPDARAHLAMLEGVFGSYKPVKLPSLALQSAASDEQIERFKWFVEDVTYLRASRDAGLLGVPEDGDRALQHLERGLKKLVKKPIFKPIAALTSKLISKATPLDLDASGLVEAFLPTKYLPPIIPFGTAYSRAEAYWRTQRGPFVETAATIAIIGDGWREAPDEAQPDLADFRQTRFNGEA